MGLSTRCSRCNVHTYKDLIQIAKDAIDEWIRVNVLEEDAFKQRIKRELDKNQAQILMKLLGFNTNYGNTWELDHCNGRAGQSAAGDFIKSKMGEEVNKWLAEQTGKLPELPQDAITSLHKQYLEEVHYKLRDHIRHAAEEKANELAKLIIKDIESVDTTDLKKGLDTIGFLLALPGNDDKPPG